MQLNNIDGIVTLPPLQVEYRLDPTVEITHNKIAYEQGYSYEYHTMLKNTRDYSFNKDSNFYLTDKHNIQNIISVKELPITYPETISTFLAFNRLTTDPMSALTADATCLTSATADGIPETDSITRYITIGEKPSSLSETAPVSSETFTDIKTKDTLEQRYYFNITFIDGMECLVYHLSGDTRYYLHVDTNDDAGEEDDTSLGILTFTPLDHEYGLENTISEILKSPGAGSNGPGENIKWLYTYYREENLIRLFKYDSRDGGSVKVLSLNEGTGVVELGNLNSTVDPEDGLADALELSDNTTIRIRPRTTKIDSARLNSKIYNYANTPDQNNLLVNPDRVSDELDNNMLVHSEYYYLTGVSLPVNMFPLKNQYTSTGITNPGNLWRDQNTYEHRRYNKLFTGTNQLQGADKIYLDHTCGSHDIEIRPGMNYINFPQQPEPVTRLNINDTTLIDSGSIASNVPMTSDRVYKKLSGYRSTTRWGDPSNEQTGMWLCTWLSGSNDPSERPVWVDRYYNPSTTGGVPALTLETQSTHNKYETDTNDQFLSVNDEVYDEVSKLTFEPGALYGYYRLDDKDNINATSVLSPHQYSDGLDTFMTTNYRPLESVDKVYDFNHDRVGIINSIKDKSLEELTIMFDFDFKNYKELIGHQILGNYTNSGFGIFNANNVSPFLFLLGSDGVGAQASAPTSTPTRPQNSSIRIYDNNFKLYNYVTNSSYVPIVDQINPVTEISTPYYSFDTGLFEHIVVKELPDNIYAVMSTGQLVEMTHDGSVIATYDNVYNNVTGNRGDTTPGVEYAPSEPTHTLSHVTYDDTFIYILQHKLNPASKTDFIITAFNTLNKKFIDYTDYECLNYIYPPAGLDIDDSAIKHGRFLDSDLPPNKIIIKDDPAPYQDKRSMYLAWGDNVQTTSETIWIHVKGDIDDLSSIQTKHDCIYGYDTKRLQHLGENFTGPASTAPGMITGTLTDNSLIPMTIVDFVADEQDNLWIIHDTNFITKLSSSREILHTHEVEEQSLLSIVITKDLENGKYVDQVSVLGKTTGADMFVAEVLNHPTSIIDLGTTGPYRKASSYPIQPTDDDPNPALISRGSVPLSASPSNQIPGEFTTGKWVEVTDDNIGEIDENKIWTSDNGEQYIYIYDLVTPFVNGSERFGYHVNSNKIGSGRLTITDPVGIVQDGDYGLMTEDFDDIILDDYPDTIYGNIYNITNGKLIESKTLPNFPASDLDNLPQLVNHYNYSKENFYHYPENNLNLKMLLQPLFGRDQPDLVNIKIDMTTLNTTPYTGKHHFAMVVNNDTGRVEVWIDGNLDEDNHVYTFDANKYRFAEVLNKNITVGATSYLNDTLLYNKLNRDKSYVITNTTLSNIYCYTTSLDYFQQLSVYRKSYKAETMMWTVPVGLRNLIEGVERVYNHSIPPKKSNQYDIQIRNSLIESTTLQRYITNKIKSTLNDITPAGTTYRSIEWTNEILDQS